MHVEGLLLDQVGRALRGLPRELTEEVRGDNLDLIRSLGSPAYFGRLARQILEEPELLDRVARVSYRHVNHFDKIVLVNDTDPKGYRLTLHLWDSPYTERELRAEMIHQHRFNFWSTVLVGELVSQNYAKRPGGAPYNQYRYVPELVRDVSFDDFYEFQGVAHLEPVPLWTKRAGDSYFLDAPNIHRIDLPRESMTCTLVLRGPRLRECSNVFNTSYPTTDTRFGNHMFTAEEIHDRLTKLLDHLERSRPSYVASSQSSSVSITSGGDHAAL